MTMRNLFAAAAAAVAVLVSVAPAGAAELSDYTIAQLLEPCMEGDNDSRWGQVAEQECEQYIRGFTEAYLLGAPGGPKAVTCLPAANNRDAEIRWAFMKWAHQNFAKRKQPAAAGLLATFRDSFGCK